MELNSKTLCLQKWQKSWVLKGKSIHHHTGPQSNGVLEGFHKFLKASFSKHISRHKEWDDVAAMAAASYNYLPNQHSKEAPFFVMFGRDAVYKHWTYYST